MLHLQTEHLIVKDVILNRFQSTKDECVDVRVCDFDDTQYHVLVQEESRNILRVSASVRGATRIFSVPEFKAEFDSIYSKFLSATTEVPYDVTLEVDLAALPETDEEKAKLATLLARIKRNVLGAPLLAMGKALHNKTPLTTSMAIDLRLGEQMYFIPRPDRVAAIFDIGFKEPTDAAIAKVFLQEFNEMRRVRELSTAPVPLYLPTAPQELTESPELSKTVQSNPNRIGFLSLAIQPRHVEPQSLDNTVDRIVQFRAYLHYHIKCNKSLLHTRMRKRVESLLQVLNRAIPDIPKDKLAATGRQFIVNAGGSAGL